MKKHLIIPLCLLFLSSCIKWEHTDFTLNPETEISTNNEDIISIKISLNPQTEDGGDINYEFGNHVLWSYYSPHIDVTLWSYTNPSTDSVFLWRERGAKGSKLYDFTRDFYLTGDIFQFGEIFHPEDTIKVVVWGSVAAVYINDYTGKKYDTIDIAKIPYAEKTFLLKDYWELETIESVME